MIESMYQGTTGWWRKLVLLLDFVMLASLAFFLIAELDNYLPPPRIFHTNAVWPYFALAMLATVLIALLSRTVSFVWPNIAMAVAVPFLILSYRLFLGSVYPDHPNLDVVAGVVCIVVWWILMRLANRLANLQTHTVASS
jgi:hypothetical protein